VIALAGLAQALQVVRRTADTGQGDNRAMDAVLGSVFRIDADSIDAVYGSLDQLQPGFRRLREQFRDGNTDPQFPKLAMAVLALERSFRNNDDATKAVRDGIHALTPAAIAQGNTAPDVLSGLAAIYATNISPLKPKVMVQGNPHYLGQPQVVAEIRAMLLAALRSAVLWRQLGGSAWDVLLRKRAMLDELDALLR